MSAPECRGFVTRDVPYCDASADTERIPFQSATQSSGSVGHRCGCVRAVTVWSGLRQSVRARTVCAEPVGSASRSTETAGARACATTAMEESTALAPRSGHPPNSVRKVAALWRTSTVRAHDRMPACPHARMPASNSPRWCRWAWPARPHLTAFALRVHLCGSARRARLVALCAVTRGCSGTVCAADSRGRHREC